METPMMTWVDSLIKFSLPSLYLDENGKKRTVKDYKGWSRLTQSDVKSGHEVLCVLTGKLNGITVIDFDDHESYDKAWRDLKLFTINDHPTVITKRGFHVYFKYTDRVRQPEKDTLNVDVLNDGKRAYFPVGRGMLEQMATSSLMNGSLRGSFNRCQQNSLITLTASASRPIRAWRHHKK